MLSTVNWVVGLHLGCVGILRSELSLVLVGGQLSRSLLSTHVSAPTTGDSRSETQRSVLREWSCFCCPLTSRMMMKAEARVGPPERPMLCTP